MVFQNRVLREISGTKREEVTEEWRRLHNEEHHDMYLSPDRVLREISGTKEEEVTEEWRRLHNEEHHDMSCHQILS